MTDEELNEAFSEDFLFDIDNIDTVNNKVMDNALDFVIQQQSKETSYKNVAVMNAFKRFYKGTIYENRAIYEIDDKKLNELLINFIMNAKKNLK